MWLAVSIIVCDSLLEKDHLAGSRWEIFVRQVVLNGTICETRVKIDDVRAVAPCRCNVLRCAWTHSHSIANFLLECAKNGASHVLSLVL